MNLTELRKLAEAAAKEPGTHCYYPTPDQEAFIGDATPERILAMLDVIEAADKWRNDRGNSLVTIGDRIHAYDAARKRLEDL